MTDYGNEFLTLCNYAEKLDQKKYCQIINNLEQNNLLSECDYIVKKNETHKGVFTVLITLLFYKFKHKEQDIRLHKLELIDKQNPKSKGFSGRSFDTKYITPTLKKLGLPSMAESGWLTRSLEQAAPYNLDFPGKISGGVKTPFLRILNAVEVIGIPPKNILIYIINQSFVKKKRNVISIDKLEISEKISILSLVNILELQFHNKYHEHGAAKLPMLAFYAIYTILLKELHKFEGCYIPPVGSHTASDRTSKTAGDLEVFTQEGKILEAIEIKLDIPINHHMILRAKEKILKFNPLRYYVLSTADVKSDEHELILKEISDIKKNHGCQLIINGVLDTLKYYLRLVKDVNEFVDIYSSLIELDTELKLSHKKYWKDVIINLNKMT